MRAAAFVLLALLASSAPVFSATVSQPRVRFKVVLKVERAPCVVRAPATVSVDAAGVPQLHLAALLPDCDLDGVPATLTVRANPAENGTDVATINF